ncbi:MAG: phenylalanine 4-monooxygenase [Chloroherpetonaceae bacterium]
MNAVESDFVSADASPLSAYEKAALGGNDPRCIPQHLDGPPPMCSEIVYPNYTEEEQQIWQTLYHRQIELLPNRACDEFLHGVKMLKLNPNKIPSLAELSNVLEAQTNWCIARIPGLLHEQDFFKLLAERVFPSTDYIRGKDEMGYTPAPDLFHDVFGHMPMLTNKDFADFYQLFGKAALNAKGSDRTALERFHWFTVEFGLIETPNGRRIYGAGTLSSATEVLHSLSDNVVVHRFSPEKIINQDYDVWHLQPILFAIESFEELKQGFRDWTRLRGLL